MCEACAKPTRFLAAEGYASHKVIQDVPGEAIAASYEEQSAGTAGEWISEEPKRPQSAYFIFVGEEKDKLLGNTPSCGWGDFAKELSMKWKSLDPNCTGLYENRANLMASDYERRRVEFREYGMYRK